MARCHDGKQLRLSCRNHAYSDRWNEYGIPCNADGVHFDLLRFWVHRGEEVIPATGATTSRQAARMGRGLPMGRLTAQGGMFMVALEENDIVDALNQLRDRGFAVGDGTR